MMTTSSELPGHFVGRTGFLKPDRRTKQRNQTFRFGVINADPDRRVLCLVKNISATGAMIDVENTLEIPDEFTLVIESDPFGRRCRVAWRKPKEIAVKFDNSRREVGPDRNDRRQSPRRSLNSAGWIRLDGGFATRECTIVDISSAGVRLSVSFAADLPATFTLLFSKNHPGRRLRTIWKRANVIGAQFI
jgi:hypothetical protein